MTGIVYFFFFKFSRNKFWAFSQMGLSKRFLKKVDGLQFYKLLGTGSKGGFSFLPDFKNYVFLSVWDNESKTKHFIKYNNFLKKYINKTESIRVLSLIPFKSNGSWDGINPFNPKITFKNYKNNDIAILTRARISPLKTFSFWANVPKASKEISKAKGVYFYKGIGEIPFFEQSTISLWKSIEDVKIFAYGSYIHRNIVKRTKIENWYLEELFCRFYVKQDYFLK